MLIVHHQVQSLSHLLVVADKRLPEPESGVLGQATSGMDHVQDGEGVIKEHRQGDDHHPEVGVVARRVNEPLVLDHEAHRICEVADYREQRKNAQVELVLLRVETHVLRYLKAEHRL